MKKETKVDGYFKGNGYRLTGQSLKIYGGMFTEVKMLEGIDAGKIRLVKMSKTTT